MKKIIVVLVMSLLGSSAWAETPSKASVAKLLDVMNAKKTLDAAHDQMEASMKAAMNQALAGEEITPAVQKDIDEMQDKTVAVLKDNMSWADMQPLLVNVYQQTFSQSEINSMLTFYSSADGQAVIKKMPAVISNSMQMMQQRMPIIMPKLKKIQKEFMEKVKADAQQDESQ